MRSAQAVQCRRRQKGFVGHQGTTQTTTALSCSILSSTRSMKLSLNSGSTKLVLPDHVGRKPSPGSAPGESSLYGAPLGLFLLENMCSEALSHERVAGTWQSVRAAGYAHLNFVSKHVISRFDRRFAICESVTVDRT